jgi:hypothetical protein
MHVESLGELSAAFAEWRGRKRHLREAAPEDLMRHACRAIGVHGLDAVARATKVDRRRLSASGARFGENTTSGTPTFSRLELVAPAMTAQPFAEVETPTGLKVRLFTQTDEALRLLSSVLGAGGPR